MQKQLSHKEVLLEKLFMTLSHSKIYNTVQLHFAKIGLTNK